MFIRYPDVDQPRRVRAYEFPDDDVSDRATGTLVMPHAGTVTWAITYWNAALKQASKDPADSDRTIRVLVVDVEPEVRRGVDPWIFLS